MSTNIEDYYPLKKLRGSIVTIEKVNTCPEYKGFPVCDVYGLTCDEVHKYMEKLSKIEMDADNLYKDKNNHNNRRKLWLFGVFFVAAFIFGCKANPTENPDPLFSFLSAICFYLPFGLRKLDIILYKWRKHQLIYNFKVEEYLKVLDSYKDYYEKKRDFVYEQGAKNEDYYKMMTSF